MIYTDKELISKGAMYYSIIEFLANLKQYMEYSVYILRTLSLTYLSLQLVKTLIAISKVNVLFTYVNYRFWTIVRCLKNYEQITLIKKQDD